MAEDKGFNVTGGGLYIPTKKKQVIIQFSSGARTTIEVDSIDVQVENGKVVGLNQSGDSKFLFLDYGSIIMIERVD